MDCHRTKMSLKCSELNSLLRMTMGHMETTNSKRKNRPEKEKNSVKAGPRDSCFCYLQSS